MILRTCNLTVIACGRWSLVTNQSEVRGAFKHLAPLLNSDNNSFGVQLKRLHILPNLYIPFSNVSLSPRILCTFKTKGLSVRRVTTGQSTKYSYLQFHAYLENFQPKPILRIAAAGNLHRIALRSNQIHRAVFTIVLLHSVNSVPPQSVFLNGKSRFSPPPLPPSPLGLG